MAACRDARHEQRGDDAGHSRQLWCGASCAWQGEAGDQEKRQEEGRAKICSRTGTGRFESIIAGFGVLYAVKYYGRGLLHGSLSALETPRPCAAIIPEEISYQLCVVQHLSLVRIFWYANNAFFPGCFLVTVPCRHQSKSKWYSQCNRSSRTGKANLTAL